MRHGIYIDKKGKGRGHAVLASSAGFTLIEVLVAFSILSIMLLALMQGMSQGLNSIDRAGKRQVTLEHARNHLASVGVLIPLEPGLYSGREEDHEWRVDISPSPYALGPITDTYPMTLLSIEIWVKDDQGVEQYLSTMRLVEVAS